MTAVKPLVVSYDTDADNPGVIRLRRSLERWGWDYQILIDDGGWRGFGRRVKVVADYCRQVAEAGTYSHVINVDARDVIATGPAAEFIAPRVPLLLATERGCWPDNNLRALYPPCPHPWRFAHSQYVIEVGRTDLLHTESLVDTADDQRHLTKLFLDGTDGIALDYDSYYVQSIAFCDPRFEEWFDIDGDRVVNLTTDSRPLLVHGNSRVSLDWIPQ